MDLSAELKNKIIEFLESVPDIHNKNKRYALIYRAFSDNKLVSQIDYDGTTDVFCTLLVSKLAGYGKTEDGQDALEAALETAKKYIGQDRQGYCDILIRELHTFQQKFSHKNMKPIEESDHLTSCPYSIEEMVRTDQNYSQAIKHNNLVNEIKEYLTQKSEPRPVVLSGEPMVGKTRILKYLSEVLNDRHVPMSVTGQSFKTLTDLNGFVFNLADHLTSEFNECARQNGALSNLDEPVLSDFREEPEGAFYRQWNNIRQNAGKKKPVVMFDEIEYLLDNPGKPNHQILRFLNNFIRSPANGYFILAGSERIRYSDNEEFSMLIGKGEPFRVRFYEKETVSSIFSAVCEYFSCQCNILQNCIYLCDGHPRFLGIVYEVMVSHLVDSQRKKSVKDDTESILIKAVERASDFLWALGHRLSSDELFVVWLISRKLSVPIDRTEYFLNELNELAEQYHFDNTAIDLDRGIARLEEREWIEWKDRKKKLFQINLCIFPLWLRHRHIKINFDEMKFEY